MRSTDRTFRFQFTETRISIQPESFYALAAGFCGLVLAAVAAWAVWRPHEFYRAQPFLALAIFTAAFAFGGRGALYMAGVGILSGLIPPVLMAHAPWKAYLIQSFLLCLVAWAARRSIVARHDTQIQFYHVINHRKGEIDYLTARADSTRKFVESLRRKSAQWSGLEATLRAVTASLYPDRVLQLLRDETQKLFPGREISIDLRNSTDPVFAWIVNHNRSALISDIRNDVQFRHLEHAVSFRSCIGVPIEESQAPVGAIRVAAAEAGAFDMDHLRLLYKFSEIAAVILRNADIYEKTDRLGKIDGLTGLSKRWYFQNRFDDLCRFARRNRSSIAVVMSDIDFFKSVNDRFGHQEGDRVLRIVASVFQSAFEGIGVTARYGGEEFIAAIPQMPVTDCAKIVESYRAAVQARSDIKVTVSCGIAAFPDACDDLDRLIDRADRALYAAKSSGRNRCEVFH